MLGPQTTPHALQFCVVARDASQPSTGSTLQSPTPPEHVQTPAVHTCWAAQGWLQPPQWSALLRVSTQEPPHKVVPVGQPPRTQVPPAQTVPRVQGAPQRPQWLGSLVVSAQLPLQAVSPVVHTQLPPVQTWPVVQVRPQPPQ